MQNRTVFEKRIGRVIEAIQTTDLDALLLNRTCNIAYLTGVVNSCTWLLVTREGQQVALVMESDAEIYREESIISDIRCFRMHDPFHLFRKMVKETGFSRKKLGLELSRPGLAHHVLDMLRFAFPKDIQYINGETLLEEIRAIKSNEEIIFPLSFEFSLDKHDIFTILPPILDVTLTMINNNIIPKTNPFLKTKHFFFIFSTSL